MELSSKNGTFLGELSTLYKRKYKNPSQLTQNTLEEDLDHDKPNATLDHQISLPRISKISKISIKKPLYQNIHDAIQMLDINYVVQNSISSKVNSHMIQLYKDKIKDAVRWRNNYQKIKMKIKISSSKGRLIDEKDRSSEQSKQTIMKIISTQKLYDSLRFHWFCLDVNSWKPDVRQGIYFI